MSYDNQTRADEFREKLHEQAIRTAVMLDITHFDPLTFFAAVTEKLAELKGVKNDTR